MNEDAETKTSKKEDAETKNKLEIQGVMPGQVDLKDLCPEPSKEE